MVEKKNTQTEANKKWQSQNRERQRYLSRRSTARNFIKKDATEDDLKEMAQLIEKRKNILSQSDVE